MSKQDNTRPSHRNEPAVNLIRSKIDKLYDDEPSAKEEIAEVETVHHKLSKHQEYMKNLSESGQSLAEIQTKWHEYYLQLSDSEKHEVWQEFYANHQRKEQKPQNIKHDDTDKSEVKVVEASHAETIADTKKKIIHKVNRKNTTKLSAIGHFKSLLLGLS